jgi:hypothetical protein
LPCCRLFADQLDFPDGAAGRSTPRAGLILRSLASGLAGWCRITLHGWSARQLATLERADKSGWTVVSMKTDWATVF